MNDADRFSTAIYGIVGRRLMYKDLIAIDQRAERALAGLVRVGDEASSEGVTAFRLGPRRLGFCAAFSLCASSRFCSSARGTARSRSVSFTNSAYSFDGRFAILTP
jgi:hypothetical protein